MVLKMKNIFVLLFLTIVNVLCQQNVRKCEIAQVCITDLSQEECGAGFIVAPNTAIFGCCPGCKEEGAVGDGGGEDEDDDIIDDIFPPHQCRPPSNCLEDGTYAPVQCKGDLFTGRCFCSDAQGNRIFGQMWRNEASQMTCACSRKRDEIEKSQNRVSTLHCSSNGDYEQLQCDDGMCWCANPRTGQPTVPPIPDSDMTLLPCYSRHRVGENYLRRCESIVFALATIRKEQVDHGTTFFGNPTTFCDYDGSYGPYQIQNGIAYCTGRDGKILGSWQAVSSEMRGMNCNCARDTNVYFPERGMTVAEVCQPNGNYRHSQTSGDVTYCVDSDGYPYESEDDWPDECVRNQNENNNN